MVQNEIFAVIGGDLRCAYVAQFLLKDRREVRTVGLELSGIVDVSCINTLDEALSVADYVILPLPLLDKDGNVLAKYTNTKLDIFTILKNAKREAVLYAGRIPGSVTAFATEHGKEMYDYYLREELQIKNAVPTAEGTVERLMEKIPTTIFGARILVTGFGRTAQALCLLLKAMGAAVTVAARKSEALAHAQSIGCNAMPLQRLAHEKLHFDAIVNTVPARVITDVVLDKVRPYCYIVDIASAPGGIDFDYAARHGLLAESALSLPGQVAPKTAGKIIKETVCNMIGERGCGD